MKTRNLIILFGLALCAGVLAQTNTVDAATATTVAQPAIPAWLDQIILKYPFAATVLMIMSIARIVFKPLCAIVHSVIDEMGSDALHAKWEKMEQSKLFRYIAWVLDYAGSIKLIKKT